jgi:hypothetical protein
MLKQTNAAEAIALTKNRELAEKTLDAPHF